ncbi:MAG: MMPL family transporter [Solirubrobacterales bacterium]
MSDAQHDTLTASAPTSDGRFFRGLATLSSGRPWAVVAVAVAIFLGGGFLAGSVFDALDPFGFTDESTESVQAERQLEAASGEQPDFQVLLTVALDGPASGAKARRQVADVAGELADIEGVGTVRTPFRGGEDSQISEDGRSAFIVAPLTREASADEMAERVPEAFADENAVKVGGSAVVFPEVGKQVEKDLQKAELYAFPIIFLLSILFFRSVVAALLPLMVGGLAIVTALAGLRALAELTDLSVFAINLITGLGLGLAIDYSLFIVSRYREELARDAGADEALRRTLDTAGRTVVFSGITVAASLAALLVFPQKFLYSMGVGGAMVALLSATIAVTVLPAVIHLLGPRINAGAPGFLQRSRERVALPTTEGRWYRMARWVMARPIPVVAITAVALLAAGYPTLGLDVTRGQGSAGILPDTNKAAQVGQRLDREFPRAQTDPVIVQLDADRNQARSDAVRSLREEIDALPGVASATPVRPLGDGVARLDATLEENSDSTVSQDAVRDIRALESPVPLRVAGPTARLIDERESIVDHALPAAAIVIVSTLIVLFLMTGSVVIPIKALVMNALTISAAFGFLVLVFQDGNLEGLLNFDSRGAIDLSNPMLIFAMAFGLSTDYGVFLFTRIKEAYDAGNENSEAVAIGLERTGRIVTAAALLFAVALGAFVTSEVVFIKEVGLGVALAVLIDASIVRGLLVPSLMRLLGDWNWWAPKPLRALHERIGLTHGPAVDE